MERQGVPLSHGMEHVSVPLRRVLERLGIDPDAAVAAKGEPAA